jgi:hypothetical protein
MRRFATTMASVAAAAGAVIALSACGGTSNSAPKTTALSPSAAATVPVKKVVGVGNVLV